MSDYVMADMEKAYKEYPVLRARVKELEAEQWFLRPVPEEDVGGVTWKQECLDVKEQLSKHLSTARFTEDKGENHGH